VIELTDEMMRAFRSKVADGDGYREGLAAVLAIVERDYSVFAHCEEPHPTEDTVCELARGHKGGHTATIEKAVDW
jgi:hypothetical protein